MLEQLDYTLELPQRINLIKSLPLHTYKSTELELLANYILYKDKQIPKEKNKYVASKTKPHANLEVLEKPKTQYTKPRPFIHTEDFYIKQYNESIEILKSQLSKAPEESQWKIKQWIIQHRLDMGIANSLLYPTINFTSSIILKEPIDLDEIVDLTNSFHISKLLSLYSHLRQSEDSKMWIDWIDRNIIEKTPLFDWQRHLLIRYIDGANQITIGRELGEYFGKIVTPSTISQALRTIYRQIAITAEKELFAFYNANNPAEWRTCKSCGEKKLIKYEYYSSKPKICKQCLRIAKEKYSKGGIK